MMLDCIELISYRQLIAHRSIELICYRQLIAHRSRTLSIEFDVFLYLTPSEF